ncbi:hypothetical protein SmJEL517_g02467 [Synchytrium microbalum]|uniref:Protein kinase domain-containing protein n=1 Tax=Synchytrium microbalum TaxID=1806994 RepID=A0A507C0E8_9FUNG|nr:uncharacterized protein SmJEL517_g02467 [Synchytrium microbalum]TPX35010.1 hypothetical protein SmJEL517_g02467 [Synchytrium microbalum]
MDESDRDDNADEPKVVEASLVSFSLISYLLHIKAVSDYSYNYSPHVQMMWFPPALTDPNKRFERYDVSLGKGAYKEVFKAFDQERFVEVAWNQLRIDNLPKRDAQHIVSEINLLASLRNDHIITMYDAWASVSPNGKYRVVFITELMTSGTLKSYIKKSKGPVKPKVLKDWCRQILLGLDYLHTRKPPVIHRDLKAENIFINGNNGQAKIGDLGLAIEKHREHISSVLGTPEFMAPELYDEHYDEKVDIYSFGMVILEIVTKEYPYSECTNQPQIYRKVMQGIKPAALSKVLDEETRRFIDVCIQSDPKKRPSAAELLLHPFLVMAEGQTSHNGPSQISSLDDLNLATNGYDFTPRASVSSIRSTSFPINGTLSSAVTKETIKEEVGIIEGGTDKALDRLAIRSDGMLTQTEAAAVSSPVSTLVDTSYPSDRVSEVSMPYKSMSMDQSSHLRGGLLLQPLTPAVHGLTPNTSPIQLMTPLFPLPSSVTIPLATSPTSVDGPKLLPAILEALTPTDTVNSVQTADSATSPPHATVRSRSRSLPRVTSRSRTTSPTNNYVFSSPNSSNMVPSSTSMAAIQPPTLGNSGSSQVSNSSLQVSQSYSSSKTGTNAQPSTVHTQFPSITNTSSPTLHSICLVHIIERKSTGLLLKMVYTVPGKQSKEAKFMFNLNEDTATNVVAEMVKENLIEEADELLARQRLEDTLRSLTTGETPPVTYASVASHAITATVVAAVVTPPTPILSTGQPAAASSKIEGQSQTLTPPAAPGKVEGQSQTSGPPSRDESLPQHKVAQQQNPAIDEMMNMHPEAVPPSPEIVQTGSNATYFDPQFKSLGRSSTVKSSSSSQAVSALEREPPVRRTLSHNGPYAMSHMGQMPPPSSQHNNITGRISTSSPRASISAGLGMSSSPSSPTSIDKPSHGRTPSTVSVGSIAGGSSSSRPSTPGSDYASAPGSEGFKRGTSGGDLRNTPSPHKQHVWSSDGSEFVGFESAEAQPSAMSLPPVVPSTSSTLPASLLNVATTITSLIQPNSNALGQHLLSSTTTTTATPNIQAPTTMTSLAPPPATTSTPSISPTNIFPNTLATMPPLASPIPVYLRNPSQTIPVNSSPSPPTSGSPNSTSNIVSQPPLPPASAPPRMADPDVMAKLHAMQENALRGFELKSNGSSMIPSSSMMSSMGQGMSRASTVGPSSGNNAIRPLTMQSTGSIMQSQQTPNSNVGSAPSSAGGSPAPTSGGLPPPPGFRNNNNNVSMPAATPLIPQRTGGGTMSSQGAANK